MTDFDIGFSNQALIQNAEVNGQNLDPTVANAAALGLINTNGDPFQLPGQASGSTYVHYEGEATLSATPDAYTVATQDSAAKFFSNYDVIATASDGIPGAAAAYAVENLNLSPLARTVVLGLGNAGNGAMFGAGGLGGGPLGPAFGSSGSPDIEPANPLSYEQDLRPDFSFSFPETTVDDYIAGLTTIKTPTNTAANLFEIEQTGPLNYRIVGGGTTIDTDGYLDTALQDAKYVGNASSSPYVDGSAAPPFLRSLILADQQSEFERYGAVIRDPSVPFDSLNVLTNEPAAVPYFQRLLSQYQIPGQVLVAPTSIGQKGPTGP